jgi:tripartite-type tricarboxylate transporter receptor subunit TctC
MKRLLAAVLLCLCAPAHSQSCPDKNLVYWQAFQPGGESDVAARQQQIFLRKRCPAIETIIQYRAGAEGALLWAQLTALPGDGANIVGINLPQIVLQPLDGRTPYRTEDIVPVYWFHFTPDALVVREGSPLLTIQDFLAAAREAQAPLTIGGSGRNSANHVAHERLDSSFAIRTNYVPFTGRGDLTTAVLGGRVDAAMSYAAFAVNNRGKVRALAVAMADRHPQLPDVPTFRELGIDWVDGAYRGIGVPPATPPEARRRLAELWAALNADPQMQELAQQSGFELVDIGPDKMDAFMKERVRVYTDVARRIGLAR